MKNLFLGQIWPSWKGQNGVLAKFGLSWRIQSINPNPVTWSLFCLGNFILPFLAWNNHQKNPGKFDFYFFDVNNIFLQKYFFQKKIFLGWKKGFRPFFGSKKQCFWQKSSIYILSNFSKNFWWLFQAKRGKICLPRQKRLQVTGLLIFWGSQD